MREKCKEINGELYAISCYDNRAKWYVLKWTGNFWQQISPLYTYRGNAVRFMNNLNNSNN